MNNPLQSRPDAVCDDCGRFDAFLFDGETLCADCYANRGSCCAGEFTGREPETRKPDDPPRCAPAAPPPRAG